MAVQGPPTPRARHSAPARHGRGGRAGRGGRGGRRSRGGGSGRAGFLALVALAVLVVGGGGAAIGVMTLGSSSSATSASPGGSTGSGGSTAASTTPDGMAGIPSSPTMIASIARVDSADAVTVTVAGRSVPVRILGIDAPVAPECGADTALAFANEKMNGQMVTLVPDPTMPQTDDQGRRLAYVVLRSQLSYTDAALTAGMARADTSRPLWYSDVFSREQSQAVEKGEGIWGAPCRAKP